MRMTMRVSAPLENSTRSVLADWVELQVLLTRNVVTAQHLVRSQAAQAEPGHSEVLTEFDMEPVDEEILEPQSDYLSERAYEELTYRAGSLGSLYPFEVKEEYGTWTVSRRKATQEDEQTAHDTYICCLLITALHSELLPTSSHHPLFVQSAEIMQIESYLSAAEIVGGQAYWFGYPRRDGSSMLTAVQRLVKLIGLGEAPDERPFGLSPHANDGTVDIVAWRAFRDGQPAAIVAYGQVASGRNWNNKPPGAYLKGHFMSWFTTPPSQQYLELLFIPVLQHAQLGESKREDYRKLAYEKARLREMDFGLVIDRLRLTELMAVSKNNERYDPEEYAEYKKEVRTWTQNALDYASGKAD